MAFGTLSPVIEDILERIDQEEAERAARRDQGPCTHRSVEGALRWYFRWMEAPIPIGSCSTSGLEAHARYGVRIDGTSKVPEWEPATLYVVQVRHAEAIARCLAALREHDPNLHEVLVHTYKDGALQTTIATMMGVAQCTVSRWIGKGEAMLVRPLRDAGVLAV